MSTPKEKSELYRDRLQLVKQRVLRDEHFDQSASSSSQMMDPDSSSHLKVLPNTKQVKHPFNLTSLWLDHTYKSIDWTRSWALFTLWHVDPVGRWQSFLGGWRRQRATWFIPMCKEKLARMSFFFTNQINIGIYIRLFYRSHLCTSRRLVWRWSRFPCIWNGLSTCWTTYHIRVSIKNDTAFWI